jgi:hypothetical protein
MAVMIQLRIGKKLLRICSLRLQKHKSAVTFRLQFRAIPCPGSYLEKERYVKRILKGIRGNHTYYYIY